MFQLSFRNRNLVFSTEPGEAEKNNLGMELVKGPQGCWGLSSSCTYLFKAIFWGFPPCILGGYQAISLEG